MYLLIRVLMYLLIVALFDIFHFIIITIHHAVQSKIIIHYLLVVRRPVGAQSNPL